MKFRFAVAVAAVLLAVAFSVPAQAVSFRTFVAAQPLGNDSNTSQSCSLDFPCRTFAVAIGQTSPGGEVIALNTAGYGTATVLSAITIMALPGVTAFVNVPASGTGITINAGANDVVILKNLHIGGSNNANSTGVSLVNGKAVIRNSILSELNVGVSSTKKMDIIDSDFWGNNVAVRANGEGADTESTPKTWGTTGVRISGGNFNNNGTAFEMLNPGNRPSTTNGNRQNILMHIASGTYDWTANVTGNTTAVNGSGTGCEDLTWECKNLGIYQIDNPN